MFKIYTLSSSLRWIYCCIYVWAHGSQDIIPLHVNIIEYWNYLERKCLRFTRSLVVCDEYIVVYMCEHMAHKI